MGLYSTGLWAPSSSPDHARYRRDSDLIDQQVHNGQTSAGSTDDYMKLILQRGLSCGWSSAFSPFDRPSGHSSFLTKSARWVGKCSRVCRSASVHALSRRRPGQGSSPVDMSLSDSARGSVDLCEHLRTHGMHPAWRARRTSEMKTDYAL